MAEVSCGLRNGLEAQWEADTGLFGFEAYYSQLQISPGSESRWGCEAPAVRAGTPELKLKEDIPPEV